MKAKAAILVSSFAVLLFMVVGGLGGVRASSNDGAYRQLQVYSEVLSRVNSEYVEDPNIPKVTDGALHGLLEALDSNSSYLSPREYDDYKAKRATRRRILGQPFPSVSATQPWSQWFPAARRIRPAFKVPTFLKPSTATARGKCRWPEFVHSSVGSPDRT